MASQGGGGEDEEQQQHPPTHGGEALTRLARLCIEAACQSKDSLQMWRKQRRTLERLPIELGEALFHQLVRYRLLTAPLLESFRYSVQGINVCGEAMVDANWMAYLSDFRHLRVLRAADCRSLSNSAIRSLAGLDCLEELDLSRCTKITNEGLEYLICLKSLQKLGISETGVGVQGLISLSSLTSLKSLDLGGLPVTDEVLSSLLALNQLEHLYIWGSTISNKGVLLLQAFPHLQFLNLAWTSITRVPPLPSLRYLNLSKCTIVSIFEGWERSEAPLQELYLTGSDILYPVEALIGPGTRNVEVLDLSATTMPNYAILGGLKSLYMLDLSGTAISNHTLNSVAEVGGNLRQLNLSGTKVESEGVRILVGHVPKLEEISLSGTRVDDSVFSFLGLMPALKGIDLSHTGIKGYFCTTETGLANTSSFKSLEHLHQLICLNLQNTLICNKSCRHLTCLRQLCHIYLRGDFLSDTALHSLSLIANLVCLSVQGAVITDSGLLSFRPPPLLEELDITDCWLLTKMGILEFCKANPGLLLRHELLPDEWDCGIQVVWRKGDIKVKRDSMIPQWITLKKASASSSLLTLENCNERKNARQKRSQRCQKKLALATKREAGDSGKVLDERIKYSLSDLLCLRQLALSN